MNRSEAIPRRRFFARLAGSCGACAALFGSVTWPLARNRQGSRTGRKGLAELTSDDFRPAIGSRFRVVSSDGAAVSMRLFKVEERPRRGARVPDLGPGTTRVPFSLVFKAPGGCPLGQGTYRVEHRRLGRLPLLLTAVGLPKPSATTFEAVFG